VNKYTIFKLKKFNKYKDIVIIMTVIYIKVVGGRTIRHDVEGSEERKISGGQFSDDGQRLLVSGETITTRTAKKSQPSD
jgi:hypothetical protein